MIIKDSRQITIDKAVGKTVSTIIDGTWSDAMMIAFTDGTFIHIHVESDGDDDVSLYTTADGFSRRDYPPADMVKIFGASQVDDWNQQHMQELHAMRDKERDFRRKQYEELKREFEAAGGTDEAST